MSVNNSVISEEYTTLRKEFILLQRENEDVKQELHGTKRQIQVFESLEKDYLGEIEALQGKDGKERQALEEKVSRLEEYINGLKSKYATRTQSIESNIWKLEKENGGLREEIEFLRKIEATAAPDESNNKLIEDIIALKKENELLLLKQEELASTVESFHKMNFTLEETVMEYKQEIEDLKESLSCKREEVIQSNGLVQKLNEEIMCLKSELENYKSRPLDNMSKGNSLFAEVDDRRVYLQKTIHDMKAQFISMKQERSLHLKSIHQLQLENSRLMDKWRADIEEIKDDQYAVLKSYKDRVLVLEKLREEYKKDLQAKPLVAPTGSFEEYSFYQSVVNKKKKEIEALREQLASRSLTETLLSKALSEANEEKRKWKLKALSQEHAKEIEKLDAELEDTKPCNYWEWETQSENSFNRDAQCGTANVSSRRNTTTKSDFFKSDVDTSMVKVEGRCYSSTSFHVKQEGAPSPVMKIEKQDAGSGDSSEDAADCDKENSPQNSTVLSENSEESKKVTFSQSTVSPKRPQSKGARQVIISKPVKFHGVGSYK